MLIRSTWSWALSYSNSSVDVHCIYIYACKSTQEVKLSKLLFYSVRCNPYCEVIVDGQRGNIKTEVLKKTTHPVWDEEFTL